MHQDRFRPEEPDDDVLASNNHRLAHYSTDTRTERFLAAFGLMARHRVPNHLCILGAGWLRGQYKNDHNYVPIIRSLGGRGAVAVAG